MQAIASESEQLMAELAYALHERVANEPDILRDGSARSTSEKTSPELRTQAPPAIPDAAIVCTASPAATRVKTRSDSWPDMFVRFTGLNVSSTDTLMRWPCRPVATSQRPSSSTATDGMAMRASSRAERRRTVRPSSDAATSAASSEFAQARRTRRTARIESSAGSTEPR